MSRTEIAAHILKRLSANRPYIAAQFATQKYFVIDDLLPEELAHGIYCSFPDPLQNILFGRTEIFRRVFPMQGMAPRKRLK